MLDLVATLIDVRAVSEAFIGCRCLTVYFLTRSHSLSLLLTCNDCLVYSVLDLDHLLGCLAVYSFTKTQNLTYFLICSWLPGLFWVGSGASTGDIWSHIIQSNMVFTSHQCWWRSHHGEFFYMSRVVGFLVCVHKYQVFSLHSRNWLSCVRELVGGISIWGLWSDVDVLVIGLDDRIRLWFGWMFRFGWYTHSDTDSVQIGCAHVHCEILQNIFCPWHVTDWRAPRDLLSWAWPRSMNPWPLHPESKQRINTSTIQWCLSPMIPCNPKCLEIPPCCFVPCLYGWTVETSARSDIMMKHTVTKPYQMRPFTDEVYMNCCSAW